MAKLISRRQVLSNTLMTLPLLAAPRLVQAVPERAACLSTAAQSEGPFYPVSSIEPRSNLIRATGAQSGPQGQQIMVVGRLTDIRCRPLENAEVQLWQADAQGRYNHPSESSQSPLDAGFLYWGKTKTDNGGNYRFVTVLPAAYSAGGSWMRPPHIHFKFKPGGADGITTQMYFPNQPLNDSDHLLRGISAANRGSLIARRLGTGSGDSAGFSIYRFDVVV